MNNEFKIISEDALKTLCKAIKKVSTVGEIIDDVNSVTDKTYSSFEIDRRLNTVVKKTDIVDNLTSTDTDKPLSANQGKILNDTKLNKTDANKTNCVSIDNVSLKEYILTNFTEREKTYYLIAKSTCTDLPKASNFYITVETPGLYTYKVTAKELNDSNGIYVCSYRTISSSWTAWQKVCTTTVADTSGTATVNDGASGSVSYEVINGIAWVTVNGIATGLNGQQICTISGLPKARVYVNAPLENVGGRVGTIYSTDGVTFAIHKTDATPGYGSFSYPVAE